MSRIRSVHPGLFTDEAFMAASMPARVLLIGLWTECDDNGIFEWKPITLKARIMPADMVEIGPLLDELASLNFIRKFTVSTTGDAIEPAKRGAYGKSKLAQKVAQTPTAQNQNAHQYGAVRNFCRFQHPQKPRSVHPITNEIKAFIGINVAVSDQYDTRPRKPNQMEEEIGEGIGGGKGKNPPPPPETRSRARPKTARKRAPRGALDDGEVFDFPQEFEALWPLFPRKIDRGRALAAYAEARQRGVKLAVIRGGLERFRAAAAGKAKQHVARPENWLRGERWLDEPDGDRVPGGGGNGPTDYVPFAYPAESAEHWRDRCAVWFDRTRGGPIRERWPDVWGPVPGEPRCRVPPEVLAEFGWDGDKTR